jgi:hypothetical protein
LALNNSTSKAKFTFSKDKRFQEKKWTGAKDPYRYNLKSSFEEQSVVQSGDTNPFGSSIKSRFDYLHMKKLVQIPSPVRYNIKGAFGEDAQ